MDQYRLEVKKGEGSFSEVFMAQSLRNHKHYALKLMKKKYETIEKVRKLKEIPTARTHFNIVQFIVIIVLLIYKNKIII